MQKSIAVIGAGIVGVASAEWLRRDGHRVTLIDRLHPGERGQTSFGNAGILARCAIVPVPTPGILAKAPHMLLDPNGPLFLKWRYLPRLLPWLTDYLRNSSAERVAEIAASLAFLNADSVEQHTQLARDTPAQRFIRPCDYLYAYRDRAGFEADAFGWAIRAQYGFRGEAIEGAAVQEWDPEIASEYRFLYSLPDHAQITDPGGYVAALFDWFRAQGGQFLHGEVQRVSAEGQVWIGDQPQQFDSLVMTQGVFADRLAAQLGIRPRMQAERGYHLMLEGPSHQPPAPIMVADAKCVAAPMAGGLRVAGVVEFGGTRAGPSRAPVRLLERSVKRLFPRLSWEKATPWLGYRPATIDSLPLLGPHPRYQNVYFAAGHQHVGLTGAAKTGRLIADMLAGRSTNVDMTPFRVDRFS